MSGVRVAPESLGWALSHIERVGDTDIFPVPFEFKALRHDWSRTADHLSDLDLDNWATRPFRQCLTPKGQFAFRVSTQLDPFDVLLLTALVYEAGDALEAQRVPKEHRVVHGYRFQPSPDGLLYDAQYDYDSFQRRCRELINSPSATHVVVADIADFFTRLYIHPMENALRASGANPGYVRAICKLINQWNFSVSYGIPVGPAASRLLAEVTIADVDHALLSEGYRYCRFSDDFRIVCDSEREAHEALAFLARTLHGNHGLTLQPQKTSVLPIEVFRLRYLREGTLEEEGSLSDRLSSILQDVGIESRYAEIEFDDLDPDTQEQVRALNLKELLREQIFDDRSVDPFICRFTLQRLEELGDDSALELVIRNLPSLYTVFTEALEYVRSVELGEEGQRDLGRRLLALLEDSTLGHLEYHRCWILSAFAEDPRWDNEGRFGTLYGELHDEFSRRELILALGRTGQSHWFKTRKSNLFNFAPWERRAFLYAASCLPGDEAKHWYGSVRSRCDDLESAVISWARSRAIR